MKEFKILGVPVHPYTMSEVVEELNKRIVAQEQTFVVTANAEIIMACQEDDSYNKIVSNAEIILPDGAGAVWAGRHLGNKVPERVAGFDLYLELMQLCAEKGYKAFFFGSAPGVADAAKAVCEERYPGVQIVGVRNGYFKDNEVPEIIEEINKSGAQLLFAALGAPKQEKWLAANRDKLNSIVLMGIGGSFDVLAGKMQRAPKWMQDASLEWLFRLYKQPSRFMRMMALPKFVIEVFIHGSKHV
ncbi:MAG: WecB/TagA/CpsF family glycosyltransferase [Phascolarctobacterium sp.]|nr:WecB/TagA/CpsF family glycosyltransferase [Phascolarctobacterium sp.]